MSGLILELKFRINLPSTMKHHFQCCSLASILFSHLQFIPQSPTPSQVYEQHGKRIYQLMTVREDDIDQQPHKAPHSSDDIKVVCTPIDTKRVMKQTKRVEQTFSFDA